MIFSSLEFFVFVVVLLICIQFTQSDRLRKSILLVASYIFYASWNPFFIPLLLGNGLVGYYAGKKIFHSTNDKEKRVYVAISIAFCLGALGYFKYANFFIANVAAILGTEDTTFLNIILPVGISFFTFQTLSYVIDLYRGRIKLCEHLPTFLLYIAFFPQLVAGPIVRASEFLPQLNRPVILRRENLILGLQIFLAGLIQKHLIADNLSGYVDSVFQNPELYSSLTLWIAMFAYAMQIFCDFSGYTLMAIGCGRIFGFRLPTNFRMPYISTSVTEFWRRWHITLSFWLRDYLYISLGGNRKGRIRTDINLMMTMLLGGLWHGASWNFVLWGGLHGGALVAHKIFLQYFGEADPRNLLRKWSGWILTFLFVCFTWIPFRSTDFSTTVQYYSGLLGGGTDVHWLSPEVLVLLLISAAWHILYVRGTNTIFELPTFDIFKPKPLLAVTGSLLLLLLFGPVGTSPFIYFQF